LHYSFDLNRFNEAVTVAVRTEPAAPRLSKLAELPKGFFQPVNAHPI
jgi:hypothetical protein